LSAPSAIGSAHTPDADHDTVAAVAPPVSSTSGSALLLTAPVALFQFGFATTPARSAAPITVGALPAKLIPIAPAAGAVTMTGPDETTRPTAEFAATSMPADGVWLRTEPAGTVALDACVSVPSVSPAAAIEAAAALRVRPTTFGTTFTTSIVTSAVALVNVLVSSGVKATESRCPGAPGRIVPEGGE